MKPAVVGRSHRTPLKHWMLNTLLGKIVGVLGTGNSRVPARCSPFVCVDLCAGDGVDSDDHTSSPTIILKHCANLHAIGCRVEAEFVELRPATFDVLSRNVDTESYEFGVRLHKADARDYKLSATGEYQAIFINADPNHIHEMPVAETMAESFTKATTFMMTLGCNVGGLKMLGGDKRVEWFGYVDRVLYKMPAWHDALLVRLLHDDSQWAYLARLPQKWSQMTANQVSRTGNRFWPKGVQVVRYRSERKLWDEVLNELFLTQKERACL